MKQKINIKNVAKSRYLEKMKSMRDMRRMKDGTHSREWQMTSKGFKCPTCGKTSY